MHGESSVILVLIPPGSATLGAQKSSPTQPNFDSDAVPGEAVYGVTLAAFFLSKYELTQGQWARACGSLPSYYTFLDPGPYGEGEMITALNPVESMSWEECDLALYRMGLTLPSEAQWEYAARAGRWAGDDPWCLDGLDNIADRTAHRIADLPSWTYVDAIDDGFLLHAPVTMLGPNPFGLHGMLGNVSEWCQDIFGTYAEPMRGPERVRLSAIAGERCFRGGNFQQGGAWARSAYRNKNLPNYRHPNLGVRPARPIEP